MLHFYLKHYGQPAIAGLHASGDKQPWWSSGAATGMQRSLLRGLAGPPAVYSLHRGSMPLLGELPLRIGTFYRG